MYPLNMIGKANQPTQKTFRFEVTPIASNLDFQLPTIASGVYYFEVNWGDGNSDIINTWNQAETTHTYGSAGTYEIQISGKLKGWQVNSYADRSLITDILEWGCLELTEVVGTFKGCSNLSITATDILDVSALTAMQEFFHSCSSVITIPGINLWDVSNVTNFNSTFYSCTKLIETGMTNWDTGNGGDFFETFRRCSNFNAGIGVWNMTAAKNLQGMLQQCPKFNQPLNDWIISSFTNLTNFLESSALSTANYDDLLVDWYAQVKNSGLSFHAGGSTYSAGAPSTSRTLLIFNDGWTITDGGPA